MGNFLSKPKQPDTSKQEARLAEQEKAVEAREQTAAAQNAATVRAKRGRNAGRRSLITSAETGVDQRTTLG
jgi:hypothetical protein